MRVILCLIVFFLGSEVLAKTPVHTVSRDLAGVSMAISDSAFTELDASWDADCTSVVLYNSSAQIIYLATGAASSEKKIPYDIPPGIVHFVNISIKKGLRVSARALGDDADTGFFMITCLQ